MNSESSLAPMNQGPIPPENLADSSAQRPLFMVAVLDLPRQYFDAIVAPDVEFFVGAKGNANWGVIVFQALGIVLLLDIATLLLQSLVPPAQGSSSLLAAGITGLIGPLLAVVGFFLTEGLLFLVAKGFGGEGKFREQCHTQLLLGIPWGIALLVVWPVPVVNGVFGIYIFLLQINVIRAAHQLSRDRAILVLLAFIVALVVLIIGVAFVWNTFLRFL